MSAGVETAARARFESPPEGSLRYFSASARNFIPRLINLAAVATMTACLLGPVWATAWSVCALVAICGVIGLTRSEVARRSSLQRGRPQSGLLAISIANTSLYAGIAVALWSTGQPVGRLASVVSLSIAVVYTLLQYYADRRILILMLTPAALAGCYIFADTFFRSHHALASGVVLLALCVVVLNFLIVSSRSLNWSRNTLRDARSKARRGEEAAEAANVAKGQFLAIMSHEIRTPLNGVLGMAQAMAGDELTSCQRERLGIVQRSGEALLAILNDILDFSKIEAGRIELERVAFDLGEVATGALAAFTGIANQKGLSFSLDLAEATGVYLGDPVRIRQILYNLISNAVKFTETGSVRARLTWREGQLVMCVRDTGPGIAPEIAQRLFQKFVQADASTTRRFGGTGLGLAICRSLADLMGGRISVESTVGQGAEFTVVLPLERVADQPARAPVEAAGAATALAPDRPLRVLVAEDNEINQLVLVTVLHQVDIRPSVVSDGVAAVEAWERERWDVILMDVQMPGMDGPTATRRIRQLEAATGRPRTPIIAVSANAMAHQVQQYLDADMDGHVAKPIEIGRLFQVLDAVLPCDVDEGAAPPPPATAEPDAAAGLPALARTA